MKWPFDERPLLFVQGYGAIWAASLVDWCDQNRLHLRGITDRCQAAVIGRDRRFVVNNHNEARSCSSSTATADSFSGAIGAAAPLRAISQTTVPMANSVIPATRHKKNAETARSRRFVRHKQIDITKRIAIATAEARHQ